MGGLITIQTHGVYPLIFLTVFNKEFEFVFFKSFNLFF
jgi:hypothetical protein